MPKTKLHIEKEFLTELCYILELEFSSLFDKYKWSVMSDLMELKGEEIPWHKYYSETDGPMWETLGIMSGRAVPENLDLSISYKSFMVDTINEVKKDEINPMTEKKIKEFYKHNKKDYLFQIYANTLNTLCFLEYKSSISFLTFKAHFENHRKSLFKLIALDKSFLTVEWVREIIVNNQLSGNTRFFNELSRATRIDLLSKKKKQIVCWQIITILWCICWDKYTYEEFYKFLKKNTKIKLPQLKTFIQQLNRCGLSKKELKSTLRQT